MIIINIKPTFIFHGEFLLLCKFSLGPVNKVQRTDGRQHVPNVVPPKGRVATLTRIQGGQRHVISWMDAPDDVFYKATPTTKKLRKKIAVVQIRRAARKPFKRVLSLHQQ